MSKEPVKRTSKNGKRPKLSLAEEMDYQKKRSMFVGMIKAECDIMNALGRMGWRDGRLRQLSEVLSAVRHEAADSNNEDIESGCYTGQTEYMYTRELAQYTGEKSVTDWDTIFDPREVTWGFRVFELYDMQHNKEA